LDKASLWTSLKVSAFVGTVLCLINQYEVFLYGQYVGKDLLKMALNYVVPFFVASYSQYAFRKRQKGG